MIAGLSHGTYGIPGVAAAQRSSVPRCWHRGHSPQAGKRQRLLWMPPGLGAGLRVARSRIVVEEDVGGAGVPMQQLTAAPRHGQRGFAAGHGRARLSVASAEVVAETLNQTLKLQKKKKELNTERCTNL